MRRHTLLAALGAALALAAHQGIARYCRPPAKRRAGESRADFVARVASPVLRRAFSRPESQTEGTGTAFDIDWAPREGRAA